MKKLLIILFSICLCSCNKFFEKLGLHNDYYVKDGKRSYHQTLRPDTCRRSRLMIITWHYRKGFKYLDTARNKHLLTDKN